MEKVKNVIKELKEIERNFGPIVNNLIIVIFFLICAGLLFKVTNINLLTSNEPIHSFFDKSIGYMFTFTFGVMVFLTLTINVLRNVYYKNVLALKYFLEYKGNLNMHFYTFSSNMSSHNDIFCILLLNLSFPIFYFFNLDYILLFAVIYDLFILYDVLKSSLFFIKIEDSDKLFQVSMANFINFKTLNDLKKTKLNKDNGWIDFDLSFLESLYKYIANKKYNDFNEFISDFEFLDKNLDYIKQKNKIEYVASYYNILYYYDSINSFLKNNKDLEIDKKILANKIEKLKLVLSNYLHQKKNDTFFVNKYKTIYEIIK